MQEGTVKFFNEAKGFGFITPNSNGKDVYVHISQVQGSISDGDIVQFEIGEGRKGPEAMNVTKKDR